MSVPLLNKPTASLVGIARATEFASSHHVIESDRRIDTQPGLNPERETVARRSALVGRNGEAEMRTETNQAAQKWVKQIRMAGSVPQAGERRWEKTKARQDYHCT